MIHQIYLWMITSCLIECVKCSRIWDIKPTYDHLDEQKCGSYDFRCIDKKSFQVCSYAAEYDEIDSLEIVYECNDGTFCDEDNPAFCTPDDPMFMSTKNAIQEDNLIKRNNNENINQRKHKKLKLAPKRTMSQITNKNDEDDEDYGKNWSKLNEDSDFYFENDDNETTEMQTHLLNEGGGGIDCQHYGYYPGK